MNTQANQPTDIVLGNIVRRPIHRDGSTTHEYVIQNSQGHDVISFGSGAVFVGRDISRDIGKIFEQLEALFGFNSISFLAEQSALLGVPRAEDLTMQADRDYVDEPGTVRINRKKTDWIQALATQKVIAANIDAVKQYLNETAPVEYTPQQLDTVQITPDRRRNSNKHIVTINITGDGPQEVAFLSGPLS